MGYLMSQNNQAEQALKAWEKAETFPVSEVEAHGFINGYNWAQTHLLSEISAHKELIEVLKNKLIGEIGKRYAYQSDVAPAAWGLKDSDGNIYDVISPKEHAREPGGYNIPLYVRPGNGLHLSLQKTRSGELIAVTYTDDEHRIVESLWVKPNATALTQEKMDDIIRFLNQSRISWSGNEFIKEAMRMAVTAASGPADSEIKAK